MAGISEDDKNRVRAASDLVAIASDRMTLRQRGREFWGCCPFHGEKTPSFKIDPDTQLWHCFGCGEGGDVFSFIMKMDDIGFVDAVRFLAQRANIELSFDADTQAQTGPKARLKEVCAETAAFYHMQLMRGRNDGAASARSYLASRHLNGDIPKSWTLGYAPGHKALVTYLHSKGFTNKEMVDANVAMVDRNNRLQDRFFNRVMFPIFDVEGSAIAFGGRVIGKGEPKYLNSQETPIFHKSNILFGLNKAKASMTSTGIAVVVEGYTDVIVLHEAGITNAVATLGTSLTIQHIRALSRHAKKGIVYLFDGDEAGQRAADRALQFIDESMLPESGQRQVELKAVTLPDGKDPAEFVQSSGADALRDLLNHAQPLIRYGIDRRLSQHDLNNFEDKGRALMAIVNILAPIKQSILAQEYASYAADRLHVDLQIVLDKLAHAKVRPPLGTDSQGRSQVRSQYGASSNAARQQDGTGQIGMNAAHTESRRQLSPQERDRLRVEREFLALCAHNPQVGLGYIGSLAQTKWHRKMHEDVAFALMEVLSQSPALSAAELVMNVESITPGAAALLTGVDTNPQYEVDCVARFLSEELSIGDMEQNVREMNAQLKDVEHYSEDDRELIYAALVAMQKDLAQVRRNHLNILS